MIVYILTTDYYVAPLVQKEWQYRDGIEGGLGGFAPQKLWLLMKWKTNGTHLTPPNTWRNTWPPLPLGHFIFNPPPVHHQKKFRPPPEYNRPPPAGNKWLVPNIYIYLFLVYAKVCIIQACAYMPYLTLKSHRIWPIWKPIFPIFRPSYNTFYKDININNINHTLLCLSQAFWI